MSTTVRRAASLLIVAVIAIMLQLAHAPAATAQGRTTGPCLQPLVPTQPPQGPCNASGAVLMGVAPADVMTVRVGIRNDADHAGVQLEVRLPPEVAADAQCQFVGIAPFPLIVLADGLVQSTPFPFDGIGVTIIGTGVQNEVTCTFPRVETCGLVATATGSWLDLSDLNPREVPTASELAASTVFTDTSSAPVSPPCDTPTQTRTRAVATRLGISAESSPRSVPRFDTTTWNVTVTNYSNRVVRNAVITNVLHEALVPPRNLTSGMTWDPETRELTVPVPRMNPGETVVVSYPTQVIAWSQVPNTIVARSGRHTSTAIADVFGIPDYFS